MRQLDADFPGPHIQVLPPPPLSQSLKPPMPSRLPSLQWSDSGYFSVLTSPSCQDMRLGLGGNWEVFDLKIIINHNTSIWNIHPSTDPYYTITCQKLYPARNCSGYSRITIYWHDGNKPRTSSVCCKESRPVRRLSWQTYSPASESRREEISKRLTPPAMDSSSFIDYFLRRKICLMIFPPFGITLCLLSDLFCTSK